MRTTLLLTGKTTDKHIVALMDDYIGRIGHYMPFTVTVIPELKNTKNLTEAQQKEREGELILKQIQPQDYVVLLDDYRLVKYVRRHTDPNMVILRSANTAYDDMEIFRNEIRDLMFVQTILHLDTRM